MAEKRFQFPFMLLEEDEAQLAELAEELGISRSQLINRALQFLGKAYSVEFKGAPKRGGNRRSKDYSRQIEPPISDDEALALAASIIKNTMQARAGGAD